MKRVLAKTTRTVTALMLAVLLLFSCAVNVMPEQLLTAEAAGGTFYVDATNYSGYTGIWGGMMYEDAWHDYWAGEDYTEGLVSFSWNGLTVAITVNVDTTYFSVSAGSSAKFENPTMGKTYYLSNDGTALTETNPHTSSTVTINACGTYNWAGAAVTDKYTEWGLDWVENETGNAHASLSNSGSQITITTKSDRVAGYTFKGEDSVAGNFEVSVGTSGTYWLLEDGTVTTTDPNAGTGDDNTGDDNTGGSFTLDISAYYIEGATVWGSYTNANGETDKWFSNTETDVVTMTWSGNICTLTASENITDIVLYYGTDAEKQTFDAVLGGSYATVAPTTDEEEPDETVGGSFTLDVSAYYIEGATVWGSYTNANGETDKWFSNTETDVVTMTWSGNICTLTASENITDIVLYYGTDAEKQTFDAVLGGSYATVAPTTDEEETEDPADYGSFTIDTTASNGGSIWGTYIDENGNKAWWDDKSMDVIEQKWETGSYVCTLIVKAAVSNITMTVWTQANGDSAAVDVEIDEEYYTTADGQIVTDPDATGGSGEEKQPIGYFYLDTSAYSTETEYVFGTYTVGESTEEVWYTSAAQSVIAQSEKVNNVFTFTVYEDVSNITVTYEDENKVKQTFNVTLGETYYTAAPEDKEVVGYFYLDTSAYSTETEYVFGTYTVGESTEEVWYTSDAQSVIAQSEKVDNVFTFTVYEDVSNITVTYEDENGVKQTFDVTLGETYYTAEPEAEEEVEVVYVTEGSFAIDTRDNPGNVWGTYIDENGALQYYSWDDQSVIAQEWNGYECTLIIKGKVGNITLSLWSNAANGNIESIDAQVGGHYYATSDKVLEGWRPLGYEIVPIEKGLDAYVVLHYARADANYDGWGVGIWGEVSPGVWKDETIMFKSDNDGLGLVELENHGYDKDGYKVALIPLGSYPVSQLGFKIHQNNWAVEDEWNKDRYIDLTKVDGEALHVYVYEGVEEIFYDEQDEANHNKFFASSNGSVLGAFASNSVSRSVESSNNNGVIVVCALSCVLATLGVAVLGWYLNAARKENN